VPLTCNALISTSVDAVNAAIAAHQAAVGPGYVTGSATFYKQAMAAKMATLAK